MYIKQQINTIWKTKEEKRPQGHQFRQENIIYVSVKDISKKFMGCLVNIIILTRNSLYHKVHCP